MGVTTWVEKEMPPDGVVVLAAWREIAEGELLELGVCMGLTVPGVKEKEETRVLGESDGINPATGLIVGSDAGEDEGPQFEAETVTVETETETTVTVTIPFWPMTTVGVAALAREEEETPGGDKGGEEGVLKNGLGCVSEGGRAVMS